MLWKRTDVVGTRGNGRLYVVLVSPVSYACGLELVCANTVVKSCVVRFFTCRTYEVFVDEIAAARRL